MLIEFEPVAEYGLGNAVDQQRDQDRREGELDIGDTHDQAVDAAAEIARDQAEQNAERAGEHHAEHADRDRDAQAVENGRQHVAALLVGAEQVRTLTIGAPERRDARIHQLQLRRIERVLHRDEWGEQREQKEQQGDDGRHHRDAGAAEGVEQIAVDEASDMTGLGKRQLVRVRLVRDGISFGNGDLAHGQAARLMVERRRGSTTV